MCNSSEPGEFIRNKFGILVFINVFSDKFMWREAIVRKSVRFSILLGRIKKQRKMCIDKSEDV